MDGFNSKCVIQGKILSYSKFHCPAKVNQVLRVFLLTYCLSDCEYWIRVWPTPEIRGGLENFEVVYFPGTELFWNFRRGLYLLGGTWYFLGHKLKQKIWRKFYIFQRNSSEIFSMICFMQLSKGLDCCTANLLSCYMQQSWTWH